MIQIIKNILFVILYFAGIIATFAQDVSITVNASANKQEISPYIYGTNTNFDKETNFYKDVGLRMARMNGGNNATKYNWRKKITSHPDWYNNVYSNNWDVKSLNVANNYPNMQVMWAFQLLGRVASSDAHNFNDWGYNNSQWWGGVNQNLAGGGVPNEDDPWGKALTEGDAALYTQEWPADSTVAILKHWFGENGLSLDKNQFIYWNMDNEADIWNGTHDDVMSNGLITASAFMDKYISVARKARAIMPEIKICGPVTTSEWQWFKWGEESITIDGKYYCWLEYFIKRCADEEKTTGIRVLDVFDLHNYPYANSDSEALQNHRIYYDKNFDYPGANGIKTINGGWDTSQTKEYIFTRINDWLDEYFGKDHGIKLGISEWGPSTDNANVASVVYASTLGTFANNGVEYFMPWHWKAGMWETLHLMSNYSQNYSVSSTSSDENTVSAYTTINENNDSLTIIIVNRVMNSSRNISVNISGFSINDGAYKTLQLSNLPANETFQSHTNNALLESGILVNSNTFTIKLPPLSTTAVLFPTEGIVKVDRQAAINCNMQVFPNPANENIKVDFNALIPEPVKIEVYDETGRRVISETKNLTGISTINLNVSALQNGIYLITVTNKKFNAVKKFIINN